MLEDNMRRTKLPLLAASALIATALFWTKIVFAPPTTLAAASHGMEIDEAQFAAPKNLPSFDDTYQRHIGVLDVLTGS